MSNRLALVCLCALAALPALRSGAEASCNLIPAAPSAPSPPYANKDLSAKATGLEYPFKGALGRIDRVYPSPGKLVAVTADGACVGPDGSLSNVSASGEKDVKAAVLLSKGTRSSMKVFDQSFHARLKGIEKQLRFKLLDVGATDKMIELAPSATGRAFLVPFPAPTAAELTDLGKGHDLKVRIAVVSVGASTDAELVSTLNALAKTDCSDSCTDFSKKGGLVCLDKLYRPDATAVAGVLRWTVDSMLCSVGPPSYPMNVFADQCEGNADCSGTASSLEYWIDTCGGVHVGFEWTNIFKGAARTVSGATGAGRKNAADLQGIRLPGREFVGSTPEADPDRNDEGVNWRVPDIDLWQGANANEDLALSGTVDKLEPSILHIYPRTFVDQFCDANHKEGCLGISKDTNNKVDTCSCKAQGCTCYPVPQEDATFLACNGGDFANRPCTRPEHCQDKDGTKQACTAPHCYKEGSVWGQKIPLSPGRECSTDLSCSINDSKRPQCGLLLFDIRDRTPPLARKVDDGPGNERGVCWKDGAPIGNAPCSKGGGSGKPARCPAGATCRGYRMVAQ